MHIPDNYLSPQTCAVMGAAMIPVLKVSVKKVKAELSKEKMPLLGIGAAFSFLIMMINIPLPGGTTGHAVGAVLVALLLGPYAACISVTAALLIQAFVFGDGGILSFGANAFNMAFIMPFSGFYTCKFIKNIVKSRLGEAAGIVFGSYIGLNLAALFTAVEFGIQPYLFKSLSGQPLYCPYPLSVSIPAMMIPHLLVAGIAEAVFTLSVFSFIKKVSPGLIYDDKITKPKPVYTVLFALICLSPIGLLASGTAWGEWDLHEIADKAGYIPDGIKNGFEFKTLIPDYAMTGLSEVAGYILSAITGAALLIILFKIIGNIRMKKGDRS